MSAGWRAVAHAHGWFSYPAATPDQVGRTVRLSRPQLLGILLGALAGFSVLLVAVALLARPGAPVRCTVLACSGQPVGPPVASGSLYVNPTSGFSVRYWIPPLLPATGSASTAGNELELSFASLANMPPGSPAGAYYGQLQFFALEAQGASPEQLVAQVVGRLAPGAALAYVLPGASVGYVPGYGAAYDYYPSTGAGTAERYRLIVLCAVHAGLAVFALADGPYLDFSQDGIPAIIHHATIADEFSALLADNSVDSVRWPSERSP
ncbi:MAG TPA: hypothetical protein VKV23_10735 [Acidimicrobiales bacterium]|nr:hypothetical protein [Acidimicrobiales bacterium]